MKVERITIPLKSIIVDPETNRKVDPSDERIKIMAAAMKRRGFADEEPLIVTADSGKYYLDAGFRRHCAATIAGLKDVPVIAKHRSINDWNDRAADKARENAVDPMTWNEQAKLAAMFTNRELAADSMCLSAKHIGYLLGTHAKLQSHVDAGTLPEEALDIPLAAARDLKEFKKEEIADAYNYYLAKGEMPERDRSGQGAGGGRNADKVKYWKKLCKDAPHVPWGQLQDRLRLKNAKEDVAWLVDEFSGYVDSAAADNLNPATPDEED
jgi:ParB-like chromosome segregation protein Spo0J